MIEYSHVMDMIDLVALSSSLLTSILDHGTIIQWVCAVWVESFSAFEVQTESSTKAVHPKIMNKFNFIMLRHLKSVITVSF
jgi:hypothetical protein